MYVCNIKLFADYAVMFSEITTQMTFRPSKPTSIDYQLGPIPGK